RARGARAAAAAPAVRGPRRATRLDGRAGAPELLVQRLPRPRRASRARGGGGACGVRAGHELEERLAEHKGTEAALVLGSGYAANVGVIPALAGLDDAIFSDELNHASIVDGCRLSRATVHRYRHADPEHLAQLLAASPARRKLIVTDTVFSMDGDTAPLAELVELKERYGGGLMVDEAHAAGVFGPNG